MSLDTIIQESEHVFSSAEFAESLDSRDALLNFRKEFVIPTHKSLTGDFKVEENDEECVYLCGNSLGLMPKRSRQLINEELDAWGRRGVEAHWNHPKNRPWATIDEDVKGLMAELVGAKPVEVTTMGTLTSNLHLALISFYQPTQARFKIMIEKKAFPSDHYAVESHLHSRGIDPKSGLLLMSPRPGESLLRTEDIIETVKNDKEIAVVLLSGIQYYTGQFFEIEKITKAGHEAGCIVGWDLAHAVGNVPLKLNAWDVDFAVWCSYKYLNSGAGGIAGFYINERYKEDRSRPRLAGWWGNQKEKRFDMLPVFEPTEGASGYQLSNPSIFTTVSLLGSLQVFKEAGGIEALREKSYLLTGYLEKLLLSELKEEFSQDRVRILTPSDPKQRGCQLSLEFPDRMMDIFNSLNSHGIIADERKPTVIRISPTPLYNSFSDVYKMVTQLKKTMKEIQ